MNNTVFSKSFNFNTIEFDEYHYTDNRAGAVYHYVARLDRGRARLVWDHGSLEVSEGDMFYIPMGISYRSFWYGTPKISFASLGFTYFPNEEGKKYSIQKLQPSEEGMEIFEKIRTEQDHSCLNVGRLYCFLGDVLPRMEELCADKRQNTVSEAMAYVNKNPDASVSEIAKHCNVSESGLYYLFKKYSSTTPNRYKQSLKTKKAKALLTTTDLSIEEISEKCGFCTSGHFRAVFKELEGTLPSRVRGGKIL